MTGKSRDTTPLNEYLLRRVKKLIDGKEHVFAGPWGGEVGYELLYWIPFLRWLSREIPSLGGRLTVCSRGGVESWYADITESYVELFDLMSPEEITKRRSREQPAGLSAARRRRLTSTVGVKQGGDLDRALIDLAAEKTGVGSYTVIPPGLVYKLLRSLRETAAVYQAGTVFEPCPIQAPLTELPLPDRFAAVRFYSGGGTPGEPQVEKTVQRIIERLREVLPVVSLDPGIRLDSHVDFDLGGTHRLPTLTPSENLRTLTAVIARASIYVGSYGGMSYIAPYVGVPAITWLAQAAGSAAVGERHLAMVRRLFASPEFGDYVVLTPDLHARAKMLAAVIAGLAEPPTAHS